MHRHPVQITFLLAILLSAATGPRSAAQSNRTLDDFTSRIQARIGELGLAQTRVSAGIDAFNASLWAYVDQDYSSEGVAVSGFGIATPAFELGPLRESGLMSELNRPAATGNISERSAVSLDRSLDPGSLRGGVVRFHGSGPRRRCVEFYGVSRGGLAPDGTTTGGASLAVDLGGQVEVDVGSKITLFGARNEEETWFADAPETLVPSMLRTGARIAYRTRGAMATVTAGSSFSESTSPSPFVAGSVGISGGLQSGGESRRQLASYSARLDAGAVDPRYTGDDGRYTTRTFLIHPVISFRFPGVQISGWYRWDLYRVPILPAAYRRSVHTASVDGEIHFGLLSAGARLKPYWDFAEDGRTIYRLACSPRSRLSVGRFTLETELELTKSNVEEAQVGGRIALYGQWERGMAAIGLDIAERLGQLRADVAVAGKRWRCAATAILPDAFRVDFALPTAVANGSFADVLQRASCSLSFELLM